MTRCPPFSLGRPEWRPLTGAELHALIPGNRMDIDEEYELAPGLKPTLVYPGCGGPPTEIFYPDGRWESHFRMRGPRSYRGRWTVESFRGGEHLCVEATGYPKRGRFVWQGDGPDQAFMRAFPSIGGVEEENVFNPYRLTPVGSE